MLLAASALAVSMAGAETLVDGLAWFLDLPTHGSPQATPLTVDGMLYAAKQLKKSGSDCASRCKEAATP